MRSSAARVSRYWAARRRPSSSAPAMPSRTSRLRIRSSTRRVRARVGERGALGAVDEIRPAGDVRVGGEADDPVPLPEQVRHAREAADHLLVEAARRLGADAPDDRGVADLAHPLEPRREEQVAGAVVDLRVATPHRTAHQRPVVEPGGPDGAHQRPGDGAPVRREGRDHDHDHGHPVERLLDAPADLGGAARPRRGQGAPQLALCLRPQRQVRALAGPRDRRRCRTR